MNMRLKTNLAVGDASWEFEFHDDSGADFMMIYFEDLITMQAANNPDTLDRPGLEALVRRLFPMTGVVETRMADGTSMYCYVTTVGVNLEHPNPDQDSLADGINWYITHQLVECLVRSGSYELVGAPRLNGPFIRHYYYTISSSSDKLRLVVSERAVGAASCYVQKNTRHTAPRRYNPMPAQRDRVLDPGIGTTPMWSEGQQKHVY